MSTSIAILGASGLVGSTLTAQILRSHLLEPGDRLQLVGHGPASSCGKLLATRIDLLDAFDDDRIEVEVVPQFADVDAEIVVISSGVSMSPECNNRRDMGVQNRAIFEDIAEQCARHVPQAVFIVISNPVELAVNILCRQLDRRRVVGMGAQQDSLRFSRHIAHDLGVSRREVRASVGGEHGQGMVPLWSSVDLLTEDRALQEALEHLRVQSRLQPLAARVSALQAEVNTLLEQENTVEAYAAVERALPDARIFVEPFITLHSMHSTPNATANATLHCIAAVLAHDRRRVHGQVLIHGELLGLDGICGLPITLGRHGWGHEGLDWMDLEEVESIRQSTASIRSFSEGILSHGLQAHDVPEEARPK